MDSPDQSRPDVSSNQKLASGLAAGAAVLCFLPWFEIKFSGEMGQVFQSLAQSSHAQMNTSATGFQFTEGILAFIAAVVAAAATPASASGLLPMDRGRSALTTLSASALALLCMVVFLGRSSSGTTTGMGVSGGQTPWFFLALILASGATFLAYRECRALQST